MSALLFSLTTDLHTVGPSKSFCHATLSLQHDVLMYFLSHQMSSTRLLKMWCETSTTYRIICQHVALRESSFLHIKQNNQVTTCKAGLCWKRLIKDCCGNKIIQLASEKMSSDYIFEIESLRKNRSKMWKVLGKQ